MSELAPVLCVFGTGSDVGKSWIATGICRLFQQAGVRVAPLGEAVPRTWILDPSLAGCPSSALTVPVMSLTPVPSMVTLLRLPPGSNLT